MFGPGIEKGPLNPTQREWRGRKKCLKYTSEPLHASSLCQPASLRSWAEGGFLLSNPPALHFAIKGDWIFFKKNPLPLVLAREKALSHSGEWETKGSWLAAWHGAPQRYILNVFFPSPPPPAIRPVLILDRGP